MQNTFVHQLVGQTVGEYLIEQLLSQKALGAVYKAHHQSQQRSVMLIVILIPEDFSAREPFLASFRQESEQLVRLSHPNLVPLYDFGEHAGLPYLVLPLLKGRSLASRLQEQGPFSPQQTLALLQQVAAGLDYAHEQGIVHGSLTPATILLDEQHVVQVAEVGFVRLLEMSHIESSYPYAHRFSIAGTFLGSSAYVAPEWVETQSMDARTDIYALGVIVLELLRGKGSLPTTSSRAKAAAAALPAELEAIIQQARERDPARRFQSAGQMARAFERALQALPEAALLSPASSGLTPSAPPGPPPSSRRRVVALLAAGAVVAAGICGVSKLDLSHLMQHGTPLQLAQDQAHAATPLTSARTPTPHESHHASKKGTQTSPPRSTLNSASRLNPAATPNTQPTPTPTPDTQPTPTPTPGTQPTPTPTPDTQPTPTPVPPTPTPVPPPTGPIIGSTAQPRNTARNFVNPADGNLSILIHLPDDSFVAYEKACTHRGVPVHYHPGIHKLVCPKHHAIFDPANGASVVQGPAPSPLPSVAITVNADGTITMG